MKLFKEKLSTAVGLHALRQSSSWCLLTAKELIRIRTIWACISRHVALLNAGRNKLQGDCDARKALPDRKSRAE